MIKESQIEFERNEISEIIAKNFKPNDEQYDPSDFEWSAHCVQMAGYRKQSGWIGVDERLPERCGCYLGCTYKGYIMVAPFYPYTLNDKPQFRYDITHWMPLPDTPSRCSERR